MNIMEVTPNWQHHSKKERKRKLNPQALRSARTRRIALLRKLKALTKQGEFNEHVSICL